jgi:uncharacterized protein YqgC (DUF456 family)
VTGLLGLDLAVIAAFGLLLAGVVGSVVPALPGALLSLVGVYLYWWHTGYADPSLLWLALLTLAGLGAVVFDWVGGAIATRASGGSTRSTAAAGVVGFLLFFVAGPFGVILGVAGTVFVLEFVGGETGEASARTAAYATAGILASVVVQALVTASILLAMVAFAFVW